ncbi:MAG: sensor histidine kinase [Chloroflexi bacterium]|nr:sensor histidine kinase [Chloroflexota bacterium]MCL5110227.1 sensor histidine kinase [Chloroflexota bacterium]
MSKESFGLLAAESHSDLFAFNEEASEGNAMDQYRAVRGLSDSEQALLRKVLLDLPLLADLSRSDVLLYGVTEDEAAAFVVGEAKPHTVPPVHAENRVGQRVLRSHEPVIFRCVARRRPVQGVTTVSSRGAPIVQSAWPVRSERGVIGVLSVHTNFLEHERQRRKSAVYRNAIAQVRQMVIAGCLDGAVNLSALGEHDASLIVDGTGIVLYISSIAENLYRKLGYADSLLARRIQELKTNESVFFKAMEAGVCAEEVVQEGDYTLVKRAIPLIANSRSGWLNNQWVARVKGLPAEMDGAVIVIQDVTEERHKEQELRIKSTMIQEIHHRVKNNLQTIAALLRLQARRTTSPDVADLLQQTIHRILSIAVVHEFLSYDESSIVNLREVMQRIVNEVTQGILDPVKRFRFAFEGEDVLLPAQQATSCALIVNELLQNAVEHGFANRSEGLVRIRLAEEGEGYVLEIADDGEGLSPGFDTNHDGSLGLQIVRTLVKDDLRGRFQLADDGGVRAIVSFPKLGVDGRYRAPQGEAIPVAKGEEATSR